MMATERIWQLARGAGNSFTFDDELEWPGPPQLTVPRSTVVLSALTVGVTLLARYGDSLVAGTAGSLLVLSGILGVVVVVPTLLSHWLDRKSNDSIFTPHREPGRYRR